MNSVNKTLYIPLFGKSYVSRKGIILKDKKAEEIWASEGFALKGKSASKWLAYYMGMRAAVFDDWVSDQMTHDPSAVVLHLGCGMDSRINRIGEKNFWYDIDFPDVTQERKRYFQETEHYHIIGADIRDSGWMNDIPGNHAIVVMEGISMYLDPEELKRMITQVCDRFDNVNLLMDCYSEFAARASKIKNPINDVGVTQVFGMDDPKYIENKTLKYVREHDMTPENLIDQLPDSEKRIFKMVYAGRFAKKLYSIYEYQSHEI